MRRLLLPFAALALVSTAAYAARITFTRIIVSPHDLGGARRVAIIYAIGDSEKVTTFVERFIDYASRETLRIDNAVENNQHLSSMNAAALKALRHDYPADLYIGVNAFTCSGTQRSAEGSEHTVDGERVQRLHMWIDVVCQARLDIYSEAGRRLFSFRVRGEGTSPRASTLSDEERDVAFEQAARYAALNAADEITPRVVRESIELDDSAPSFEEGLALIAAGRVADARAVWEAALRGNRDSAALQYNLSAVSEALGDLTAAQRYLQAAVRLSPREPRYRTGLDLFLQRNASQRK
jgi:tetratricopeptide (TPR) repeat protein